MTIAERNARIVKVAADRYRSSALLLWSVIFEEGQIPGTVPMSGDRLLGFFRNLDPETWTRIARQDPREAYRMLKRYGDLEQGMPPAMPLAMPPLPGVDGASG